MNVGDKVKIIRQFPDEDKIGEIGIIAEIKPTSVGFDILLIRFPNDDRKWMFFSDEVEVMECVT